MFLNTQISDHVLINEPKEICKAYMRKHLVWHHPA